MWEYSVSSTTALFLILICCYLRASKSAEKRITSMPSRRLLWQVLARVGDDMGESQGRGSLRMAVTSRSEKKAELRKTDIHTVIHSSRQVLISCFLVPPFLSQASWESSVPTRAVACDRVNYASGYPAQGTWSPLAWHRCVCPTTRVSFPDLHKEYIQTSDLTLFPTQHGLPSSPNTPPKLSATSLLLNLMYWFCPHLISFLPSFSDYQPLPHLRTSLSWLSDSLILASTLISLTSPWLSQLSSLGACHFSTCLPEVAPLSPWLNVICFSYIIYFNPHKNPMIQVLLSLSPLCRRRKRLIKESNISLSSVQFSCSVVSDSLWPHGLQHTRLPITNSWSLFKLMSIESVMPSNHLLLCRPLLLPLSIFPSIRVFSSKSALSIRWPNYWSFSFNISPSNEY